MYRKGLKRLFDLVSAVIILTLLSPMIIILILLLTVVNNGSAFFLQTRPGKNHREFSIIKFRTMRAFDPKRDENEHSTSRITKIGGFVRKYSLDEVLQLVNVIKGEMSLVGPRPLLMEYVPLYNEEQSKRHDVAPGVTGWAQVNGRNSLNWDEKFRLDVWYVQNLSFALDIKILFLTLFKVFNRDGINRNENTVMPVWQGNAIDKASNP